MFCKTHLNSLLIQSVSSTFMFLMHSLFPPIISIRFIKVVLPCLISPVCHVGTELAQSQGQTAIMKTDWSQQRPHIWQAGRAAPVAFFRQPPSLTAECCRLLNLRQFRYPWRAVRELGFHCRKCKFKSLFMPQNDTDPLLSLPVRDGGMSGAQLARDKETENVCVCVCMCACICVTKRNSVSWRTDWLLGKAFCHIKTPCPLHLSP